MEKQKRPRISTAARTLADNETAILEQFKIGVPVARIADAFGVSRPTLIAFLDAKTGDNIEKVLILEIN